VWRNNVFLPQRTQKYAKVTNKIKPFFAFFAAEDIFMLSPHHKKNKILFSAEAQRNKLFCRKDHKKMRKIENKKASFAFFAIFTAKDVSKFFHISAVKLF